MHKENPMPDALRTNPPVNLNLEEAALFVGVSSKTLQRAVKAGSLKASRVGTRLIFPRAELDRWLVSLSES